MTLRSVTFFFIYIFLASYGEFSRGESSPLKGRIFFRDGFESVANGKAPKSPWFCHAGDPMTKYTVQDGRLVVKSATFNPVVEVTGKNWRDCLVSVQVRNIDKGGNWLGIAGPGDYRLVLSQPDGGIASLSGPGGIDKRLDLGGLLKGIQEHQLQLAYSGRQVKALINGKVIFEVQASDDVPAGGLKLLGSWCSWLVFYDITVQELSASEFASLGTPISPAVENSEKDVAVVKKESRFICTVSAIDSPVGLVYAPGDSVKAKVEFTKANPGDYTLNYRLVDYYQNEVWSGKDRIKIQGVGAKKAIHFVLPKKGLFRLEVSIEGEGLVGEIVLGAVSKKPMELSDQIQSPFGISPILDKYHLTLAKRMGASWLRLHDMDLATYWPYVEAEKGKFQWRDAQVDLAVKMGFQIMGGFEGTPLWASDAPEELKQAARSHQGDPSLWQQAWGYPPTNLKDVENYVRQTVRHYKGRINAWEVWNEPHVDLFWKGSVKQYVEMSKVIYETAKAEDPNCIIVGGGGVNLYSQPWIEEAFNRGLLNYLDVFGIHSLDEDAIKTVESEEVNSWIERVFKQMKKYGKVVPIWMTEGGGGCASFLVDPELHTQRQSAMDYRDSAANLVRSWVIGLSRGVERLFWWRMRLWPYEYHQANQQESLLEYTTAPKATFYSHAAMVERLVGAKYVGDADLGLYLRCRLFQRDQQVVAVLWTVLNIDKTGVLKIECESPIEIFDIMGNSVDLHRNGATLDCPVSYEPTYLVAEGITAKELGKVISQARQENFYVTAHADEHKKSAARREVLEEKKRAYPFAIKTSDDRWQRVNLRPFTNMGFTDEVAGDGKGGWADGGPLNDMRDMPLGVRTYCGVPFDVIDPSKNNGTSIIILRSPHGLPFPLNAKGIPVGQRLDRLYFFQSSVWAENAGRMGSYLIHYSDGSTAEIPIVSGKNNGDWWLPPEKEEQIRVAAIITYNYTVYQYRIKYLRVMEWINPHPEKTITRFDFISANDQAMPILLAVTGVKTDKTPKP